MPSAIRTRSTGRSPDIMRTLEATPVDAVWAAMGLSPAGGAGSAVCRVLLIQLTTGSSSVDIEAILDPECQTRRFERGPRRVDRGSASSQLLRIEVLAAFARIVGLDSFEMHVDRSPDSGDVRQRLASGVLIVGKRNGWRDRWSPT
jgi:hypothetical protein